MKLKIALLSVLLAAFYLLIFPSTYYSGDMVIHIPFVQLSVSPKLYQSDYLAGSRNPQGEISFYYLFLAQSSALTRIPITTIVNIYYFFYLTILFAAILWWSIYLTGSILPGIITSLLIMSRFQIGGAAISILEPDFLPRSVGVALSLTALAFLYRRQPIPGVLLLLGAFLLHPLTVGYAVFLFALFLGLRKIVERKISRTFLAFLVIVVVILVFLAVSRRIVPHEWLDILRQRNPYAFPDLWTLASWVKLSMVVLPGLLVLLTNRRQRKDSYLVGITVYLASLTGLLVQTIFTVLHPLLIIIQMQLGRLWLFPALYSLIISGSLLRRVTPKTIQKLILICSLSVLLVTWDLKSIHNSSNKQLNAWLESEHWAENTTHLDCVFLVPFMSRGFRMESKRAITGEYKDGALSFYSQDFALEWERRLLDLGRWQSMSDADLMRLKGNYKFNYIVDDAKSQRRFPVVFVNQFYKIYATSENSICGENI